MTVKQKQCLLAFLDFYAGGIDGIWGAQSQSAADRFLRAFGPTEDLEKALKHAVCYGMPEYETKDFWDEIEFFDRDEMKCKCGGKYCDGYPHEIQPLLMQILDRARRWSGHPIVIVSGLRCKEWNRIKKGVATSQHQYGEAADVYFYGVSANAALAWLQSQPDVRYAYRIEGCNNIHFDIQPVGR